MNKLTIRIAKKEDFLPTEQLARQAFTDRSRLPGDLNEHYVLHLLRQNEAYIPELDYVAEDGEGRIVGQITWSHARIVGKDGTAHPAVTFGPLSVAPALQGKGIGSALVVHTLECATKLGHTRVVLMGHPAYYPRFGFEAAAGFGITAGDGNSYDACMVLALQPGAFSGVTGRIEECSAFRPDDEGLAAFNKTFKA